ncbi:MAG: chromate efflux transporter [Chloroflexota bacterium]|nr:chromate efflux transporter [Chloroflexota bacterium]
MTLAHPPAQYCLTKSCLPFRYKLMTHETTGKDRDDLPNTSLPEIAWLFLKLGSIGFGGPAANTALMEQEVVTKRRWLTHEHFLDLLAAANLIPGANIVEMAAHVGYVRAGWRGLVVAGAALILPAFLISLTLSWLYVRFGALPQGEALLYGIGPAVLAVVWIACYRLGRAALRDRLTVAVALASLVAALAGVNAIVVLLAAGAAGILVYEAPHRLRSFFALALLGQSFPLAAAPLAGWIDERLVQLGLFFLKVGALLFGSGMVLFAFIQEDVVEGYGWLTQQQLVDAIAVGQMTPGPVLSSATFIGYLVAGAPGALVATFAVFLPSFLITAFIGPWIPRLRRSTVLSAFLRSVNAAVVALILAVSVSLLRTAIVDVWTVIVLAAALAAMLRFRVETLWLVGGGAAFGLLHFLITSA